MTSILYDLASDTEAMDKRSHRTDPEAPPCPIASLTEGDLGL